MYRRRHGLGSLGVTPATDTAPSSAPQPSLNTPKTVAVLAVVALAIGGLVWLTEKDKPSAPE